MASKYTDELKAQVIAEWKAGNSLPQLEVRFGVPPSTIHRWTSGMERQAKTKSLSVYDYDALAVKLLDGSISALGAISDLSSTNKAWLERQDAGQLAILYGVIADKLYRVLGAIRRPDAGGSTSDNTFSPGQREGAIVSG